MRQKDLIQMKHWDNLIILDALRYDIFNKLITQSKLDGKLLKLLPDAIDTKKWYKLNFGKKSDDVVLVTAHPVAYRFKGNFHKSFLVDGDWLNPEETLRKAVRVQEKYPDKKRQIHLIQPHIPFIGSKGERLSEEIGIIPYSHENLGGTTTYEKINKFAEENGFERLKECYTENLQIALKAVEKYVGKLEGSKIITSDHGEAIGEGGKYRHNINEIKKIPIPWFVCKSV